MSVNKPSDSDDIEMQVRCHGDNLVEKSSSRDHSL